jgi:Tol biopolymer transport system component
LVLNDDLEPIDLSGAASAGGGRTRRRSAFRVRRGRKQVALALLVAAVSGVTGAAVDHWIARPGPALSSPATAPATGPPIATVTTAIAQASGVSQGCVAFSRGGLNGGIHLLGASGTLRRITTDPGDDQAAWSPDGAKIAFNRYTNGDQNIFIMRSNGAGLKRLTTGRSNASPTWSADGSRILFTREVAGRSDFYTMRPDGTDLRRLTKGRMDDGSPVSSPDGSTIAFVGSGPRNLTLYVMRADGSSRRSVGGVGNAASPRWSPHGTEIAFVDEDDGSIHVVNPDGSSQRKVLDVTTLAGDIQPNFTELTWSPDGTKFVFAAGNPQTSHLYEVGTRGSGIKQLTTGPMTDESPAWSPTPACP